MAKVSKEFLKLTFFSFGPLSKQIEELFDVGVSEQENGAMLLVGTWWRIKQEKLIEKLLLIMWRLRVPICLRVLELSKLCRCLKRQLLTAIYY